MKDVARYRALGSLCRQQAAYNPDKSWKLLAQAEHWEHLAQMETTFAASSDRPEKSLAA